MRTLTRMVREGHSVTMCHASLGNRGSFVYTSAEIAKIRLEEARRAASIIGAEHHSLGLSSEINAADPAQRRLAVPDPHDPSGPHSHHSPNDYMVDLRQAHGGSCPRAARSDAETFLHSEQGEGDEHLYL